jgi:hypothetical protein
MKHFKIISISLVAAVLTAIMARADSLPLIQFGVNGTIIYNTNNVVDTNTVKIKAQQFSFVATNLIKFLMTSPSVSNTVVDVTKSNGIPAGSHLAIYTDFSRYDLYVTNASGFSFPLHGHNDVEDENYDYGFMQGSGGVPMVSSFSLHNGLNAVTHKPLPATETDNLIVHFFFDDDNGNAFDTTGNATLTWTATTPANGSQSVTESISFEGTGDGLVNYNNGIATVNVTGKGSANEVLSNQEFPFYIWWNL